MPASVLGGGLFPPQEHPPYENVEKRRRVVAASRQEFARITSGTIRQVEDRFKCPRL
jgi:hypothetical protein